jgi:hypothetical protein
MDMVGQKVPLTNWHISIRSHNSTTHKALILPIFERVQSINFCALNLNYAYLNSVLTAQRTLKSNWLLLCRKINPAVAQTVNRRPQIAKPKFEPRLVQVRFVENRETLRQVVLQILLSSRQHHSTYHPPTSSSTRPSHQDKRMKPGNFPKGNRGALYRKLLSFHREYTEKYCKYNLKAICRVF